MKVIIKQNQIKLFLRSLCDRYMNPYLQDILTGIIQRNQLGPDDRLTIDLYDFVFDNQYLEYLDLCSIEYIK